MKDGYVFQGDMVFTKEEKRSAMPSDDADSVGNSFGSNAYGIMNSVRKKWPNIVVPYDTSEVS